MNIFQRSFKKYLNIFSIKFTAKIIKIGNGKIF